jgi:3-oxoadipate enol-lactonase
VHRADPFVLNYRLEGAGPRVVLLHPIALDLTCFDAFAAQLCASFAVLRVDLPGHGGSPPPPAPTLEDYAEGIHKTLVGLNFTPAAVIGFSFGGMLAQVLALNHPGDVSALVISACASTLTDEGRRILADRGAIAEREGMSAVVDATLARWFSASFREQGGDRMVRKRLLEMDPRRWAEAWRSMAAIDTAPRLGAIAVPTLCLAGESDQSATTDTVSAIASRITGARLHVVPDAPHMLFIEHPEAVTAVLVDFLMGLSDPKGRPKSTQ